jgi:hypothetical protein
MFFFTSEPPPRDRFPLLLITEIQLVSQTEYPVRRATTKEQKKERTPPNASVATRISRDRETGERGFKVTAPGQKQTSF